MTNINVRSQQLVQTQLKKADVKTVDEGKQNDSTTSIKLIITDFQNGKIDFTTFEEQLKKLDVRDLKIAYSKDKEGNERAGISFKHDNKTYSLNVPKSYVEPPLEEDPARGAQANTVNTASEVNEGIINEYAEDLKKKLAEYADMKAQLENFDGTYEEKFSLLKGMQNLIRQLFDKHFHFTFTTHNLKQELMNDYVNWNTEINKLTRERSKNAHPPCAGLELYLDYINPYKHYYTTSEPPYSEPERLLESKQKVRFYNNELITLSEILKDLNIFKTQPWYEQEKPEVKEKVDQYIEIIKEMLEIVKTRAGEDSQTGLNATLTYNWTHGYRYDTPEEALANMENDLKKNIPELIGADIFADNILDGDKPHTDNSLSRVIVTMDDGNSIDIHATNNPVLTYRVNITNLSFTIDSYQIIKDEYGKYQVMADITINITYDITTSSINKSSNENSSRGIPTTPELVETPNQTKLEKYHEMGAIWRNSNESMSQSYKISFLRDIINLLLDLNMDELSGDFVKWNATLNQVRTEEPTPYGPSAEAQIQVYVLNNRAIDYGYSPMTHADYYAELPDGLSVEEKINFFENEITTIKKLISDFCDARKYLVENQGNEGNISLVESQILAYEKMLQVAEQKLDELLQKETPKKQIQKATINKRPSLR